jgi:hypothetical protein
MQAATVGCMGRDSQNSAEAHVALGWDAATASPSRPAHEHPSSFVRVSHRTDARHRALGRAQRSTEPHHSQRKILLNTRHFCDGGVLRRLQPGAPHSSLGTYL